MAKEFMQFHEFHIHRRYNNWKNEMKSLKSCICSNIIDLNLMVKWYEHDSNIKINLRIFDLNAWSRVCRRMVLHITMFDELVFFSFVAGIISQWLFHIFMCGQQIWRNSFVNVTWKLEVVGSTILAQNVYWIQASHMSKMSPIFFKIWPRLCFNRKNCLRHFLYEFLNKKIRRLIHCPGVVIWLFFEYGQFERENNHLLAADQY